MDVMYQAGRSGVAVTARLVAGQQLLHLGDLLALGAHDRRAELKDLGIGEVRLFAHQDRTGVVRDHGPQELTVADGSLRPPRGEAQDADDGGADRHSCRIRGELNIDFIVRAITTAMADTIMAVM